eukprot:5857179-Pyramimonas_sp.AAC.1
MVPVPHQVAPCEAAVGPQRQPPDCQDIAVPIEAFLASCTDDLGVTWTADGGRRLQGSRLLTESDGAWAAGAW